MGFAVLRVVVGFPVLVACAEGSRDGRFDALAARVDSLVITVSGLGRRLPPLSYADLPAVAVVSTAGSPSVGSDTAQLTIMEFGDYRCPFCRRHALEVFPQLRARQIETGRVRYIARDFPIVRYAGSRTAAIAAACVRVIDAEAYWPFRESLYRHTDDFTTSALDSLASAVLGPDIDSFTTCQKSLDAARSVERDVAEAKRIGVGGTPTFVVGYAAGADDSVRGVVIHGAAPLDRFLAVIDSLVDASTEELVPRNAP